jgi:hypothetical protein
LQNKRGEESIVNPLRFAMIVSKNPTIEAF